MRAWLAVLGICGSLMAPGVASAQFEGVVTGTMFSEDGKPLGDYTQSLKGPRLRWDMTTPMGDVSSIIDGKTGSMTTLMHAQKMYMSMDFSGAAKMAGGGAKEPAGAAPKFTKTGKTETIAGHQCEHYLIGDDQDVDICAAKGLGFMGMGSAGAGGAFGMGDSPVPNLPAGIENLMAEFKDGFFPLKLEKVEGGRRHTVMLVTSVQPKALPESVFTVPEGYRQFSMPNMPTRPKP